ncbi:MAG: hypothetical protein ACLTSX_12695 [Collinsella sp.]
MLINKIDALPVFDAFSMERVRENILMRNPNATIIPISAKTGRGHRRVGGLAPRAYGVEAPSASAPQRRTGAI